MNLGECIEAVQGKLQDGGDVEKGREIKSVCAFPYEREGIDAYTLVLVDYVIIDYWGRIQKMPKKDEKFLQDANPAGIVVKEGFLNDPHLPGVILVSDIVVSTMSLAAAWRQQFNIPVVAVTGSFGKTTTTFMVKYLLRNHYRVALPYPAGRREINTTRGLPWMVLKLKKEDEIAVFELATLRKGHIAPLTKIAQPQIGIVTVAGPIYKEGLPDVAAVAQEKGELFKGLPENGIAIINQDDVFASYWQEECAGPRPQVTFGIRNSADVMAKNVELDEKANVSFDMSIGNETLRIKLKLKGTYNVYNALAATAAALILGIPLSEIQKGLASFPPVIDRLEELQGVNGSTILFERCLLPNIDSALEVLTHRGGEMILVIDDAADDIIKEREQQIKFFEAIGNRLRKAGINKLYTVGRRCLPMVKTFGTDAHYFKNKKDLITALREVSTSKSTILIKGRLRDVVVGLTENK